MSNLSNVTKGILLVGLAISTSSVLWANGMFGTPFASEAAVIVPVANSVSIENIKQLAARDIRLIDVQLQLSMGEFQNISPVLPQGRIVPIASRLTKIAGMMARMRTKLEAGLINSNITSSVAVGVLDDIGRQTSNATSILGIITANASDTALSSAQLQQILVQLQTALAYLQNARIDIQKLYNTIN